MLSSSATAAVNSVSHRRVALVTGAGQGIGRAIALKLASDGFDVTVNDLPHNEAKIDSLVQEIQEKTDQKAEKVLADVSKEDQVKAMVDYTIRKLEGLEVLVANAGVSYAQPLLESTVEDWDRMFSVNSKGVMLCYKYAAHAMIKQGRGGRIIGACSAAGKKAVRDMSAYSASKFAVRGLTQSASLELASHGINVNCFAPGAIRTEMMESLAAAFTDGSKDAVDQFLEQYAKAAPLGRLGTPDDVAHLVSFLAGPGSAFITGQMLGVDGGLQFD